MNSLTLTKLPASMLDFAYHYRAKLNRVVDGDTVDVSLDLGFNARINMRLRILGIDSPERGQPGFEEATQFLWDWFLNAELADPEWRCIVHTVRKDSFGRWLADIYAPDGTSVAEVMLHTGHAVPYSK